MRVPMRLSTAALAALLLLAACGGSSSSTRTAAAPAPPAATAAWSSATQRLCLQKRAAIANLGAVHITYAGIATAGLPAVKRSLDGYLSRLIGVLRTFSVRQRQLTTPAAFVSAMGTASEIDAESEAATERLRAEIAGVANPGQLTAAFRSWLASLQQLSLRGEGVARRLNLPACMSGSAATGA